MKVGRPATQKYITFTCDAEDCNKEKTVKETFYFASKRHFCSTDCAYASRRTVELKERNLCLSCKKKMLPEDLHMMSRTYSSYCKVCREGKDEQSIKDRKHSRFAFVLKFNSIAWLVD